MELDYFKTHLRSCKAYADTDLNGGYFVALGEITAICETAPTSTPFEFQNAYGKWECDYTSKLEVIDFKVEDEAGNEIEVLHDSECLELLSNIINQTI